MMASKLILVRHGQSKWNLKNLFTGWTDVGLTKKGEMEAKEAGEIINQLDFKIDVTYTSFLKRAIHTLWIILDEIDRAWLPVHRDWRFNERHYGSLQGLDKSETTKKYGEDQVHLWRRSYDIKPPELEVDDERHPINDERYTNIDGLPASESLATTLIRVQECWKETILLDLKNNKNVLLVAHGNSLRALVKMLDNISEEEITQFNIPTGVPILYELDDNFQPISRNFLGDEENIKKAMQSVANQAKSE
ncbi:MAG: 2,3-diphosphoglycerate-dependent phosphoglycerate mutase [Woeseiaceae bacterium]|nr:2,3-diphosphoglycerate-dependent phosphoglycerate mutase [Woeseiaceae bacterium]MDG1015864.1 2,3-diphosphoglycerate-dependent phosphoglycerate mutase [Woeseiaceae bacterium]MDG1864839.1 2,3-diphosphoglycerate-dependent phosphoglycerate mutase [Woeseiaceae bacterium]